MKRLIEFTKIVSPRIAELFGLKPVFVYFLVATLGAICFGMYNLNINFVKQNALIAEQIEETRNALVKMDDTMTEHDKRITTLEIKSEKFLSEAIQVRSKINDQLARLDTKMDMVTIDVRELTNHAIRSSNGRR